VRGFRRVTIPTPSEVQARISAVKTHQIATLREACERKLNTADRLPTCVDVNVKQAEGVVDIVIKELRALGWCVSFHAGNVNVDARLEIDIERNEDPTGY
jgi:hypothetical protein